MQDIRTMNISPSRTYTFVNNNNYVPSIISSATLKKLYCTRFYLAKSLGSANSHHQAIHKNCKHGNPIYYIKDISPLHCEYIVNIYKTTVILCIYGLSNMLNIEVNVRSANVVLTSRNKWITKILRSTLTL